MQQYQRDLKLILKLIDVVSQVAANLNCKLNDFFFVCKILTKILTFAALLIPLC